MSWNQFMIDHINWSVFWRKRSTGKWVRKRFREDLHAALTFIATRDYDHMTLHSDNAGFPPPKSITQHERVGWKVVKRKGKKYKVRVTRTVNLMREYNDKGVWWCAHCIQLRRFKFAETERGPEMYCPACGANNYMWDIRRHNPKAAIIEQAKRQRRTRARRHRRSRR